MRTVASYTMIVFDRVRTMLLKLDRLIAQTSLAMGNEEGVLLSFLFHGLYEKPDELCSGVADPELGITVEMFRRFLDYFQEHAYTFVSPADMARGLKPASKSVLVTFDDGYYNNVRALPLLTAFRVPAVLFVSTEYILQGKSFWWDVLEREAGKRGTPRKQVRQVFEKLKRLRTGEAEAYLRAQFGTGALTPVSDVDRPFTLPELRDFAKHPLISLGNHTSSHAILTRHSAEEARKQIQDAQDDLRSITGSTPEIIAYPNGEESSMVVDAARSAGIRFGLGVHPARNRLPLQPGSHDAMTLKRFTLKGDCAIEPQCRVSRSLFSLYSVARGVRTKVGSTFSPLQPA